MIGKEYWVFFNMKKYLLLVLLVGVWSCEKYEHISDTKRFNKKSGQVEVLLPEGWVTVQKIISDANEKQKKIGKIYETGTGLKYKILKLSNYCDCHIFKIIRLYSSFL